MAQNTKFLLQADEQIEVMMDVISEALVKHIEAQRNGEPFDALVSVAMHSISASRIIASLLEGLEENGADMRRNAENLALFLTDKLEEYPDNVRIFEIIQALLAVASSLAMSFAEEYYNQDEASKAETTEL